MSTASLLTVTAALAAAPLSAIGGYLIAARKQSRLKLALNLAAHTAGHDQLTGLPNRAAMTHRLTGMHTAGQPIVLAIVNLDQFADINTWGYRAGDQLLVHQAQRARYHAAQHDGTAYRLRRDEFAIIWPAEPGSAAELARQLLAALAEPVDLYVNDYPVWATARATAGVSTLTGSGNHPTSLLLTRANTALQHGKLTARGTAVAWQPHLAVLPRPDRNSEKATELPGGAR